MDDALTVGIRAAGQSLGVSPTTLRRLEQQRGLRVPRLPNGQRRYPRALLSEIAALLYGPDASRIVGSSTGRTRT